ncbi:uncharacterized protein [Dysidea avara]|uniref:uncharacterized protein isoform X3 n=1 Tax=Dysidea avara TaxID=196820 RepID=UPI003317B42C
MSRRHEGKTRGRKAERPDMTTRRKPNEEQSARIILAVQGGNITVLQKLHSKGIDVNNVIDQERMTPIFYANTCEMVLLLIKWGANINDVDDTNSTPLHWAAHNDMLDIVELLVNNGADCTARDKYGYTPLIRATYLKFSRIVYYFVQIKKMDITFYEMRWKVQIEELVRKEESKITNARTHLSLMNDGTKTPDVESFKGDSLVADDHTEDVLDSFAVDDNSAKEDIPQLPPVDHTEDVSHDIGVEDNSVKEDFPHLPSAKSPGIKICDIIANKRVKLTLLIEDSSVSSDDKELIIVSVDAIYDQNMFTYNEVVDLCLASGHTKKKLLDDKLDTLFSDCSKSETDDSSALCSSKTPTPSVIWSENLSLFKSKYSDILQSFPDNYLQTLHILQDSFTDDLIVSIVSTPNAAVANKMILDYFLDGLKCNDDLIQLCDLLKTLSDSPKLLQVIDELRKDLINKKQDDHCSELEHLTTIPNNATTSTDTTIIVTNDGHCSHTISTPLSTDVTTSLTRSVTSPSSVATDGEIDHNSRSQATTRSHTTTNSEVTSDGHHLHTNSTPLSTDVTSHVTGSVASPSPVATGGGIEHNSPVSAGEVSPPRKVVTNTDVQQSLHIPISAMSTTSTQLSSSGLPHYQTSVSLKNPYFQYIFSNMESRVSSKVLQVLKRNYTRLCQCLPQNYEKTVDKLKQIMPNTPDNFIDQMRAYPETEIINEVIMSHVIFAIRSDYGVLEFCNAVDKLYDDVASKKFVASLRNELLEALSTPTFSSTWLQQNYGLSASGMLHTSDDSSLMVQTTPVVSVAESKADASTEEGKRTDDDIKASKEELKLQMMYKSERSKKGIRCPLPPLKPPKYVCREEIMDEMVTKLLGCTTNPNEYGPSLTITGAGGFGKTTIVTALCHHPLVQAHFTEGFVFIGLGPQPADPSSKLSQLYHLLTGQYLKQGDVNHAETELNLITSRHCQYLLVVIDDVWHVEDAEPMLRAFRGCKIVLTTRMKDIGQRVPTMEVVEVGPMTCNEAKSLLIHGVIDNSQLSSEDMALLTEIAKDVHLWPLLLSLIRGQLAHNLKDRSIHDAIKIVNRELSNQGLTAFDRSQINKFHKHAVKVCLGVTLELLKEDMTIKLKQLIFWNGIGNSLQRKLLHILWKVPEYKGTDIIEVLWSYGLVQFSDIILHPYNKVMPSVEVHTIISHFVIETLQPCELPSIISLINYESDIPDSMGTELSNLFNECYRQDDVALTDVNDQLKYVQCETENCEMQSYLKRISMSTIIDPHFIKLILEQIKRILMSSVGTTFSKEMAFDELMMECQKTTRSSYKWSRKLITKVQQCITQRNYQELPPFLEDFLRDFPISSVVTKAYSMVQECIACYGNHLSKNKHLMLFCESLHVNMPCNHMITWLFIPYLKLAIDKMEKISSALQKGHPYTEGMFYTIARYHYHKKRDEVYNQYVKKLEEIAPITHEVHHSGQLEDYSSQPNSPISDMFQMNDRTNSSSLQDKSHSGYAPLVSTSAPTSVTRNQAQGTINLVYQALFSDKLVHLSPKVLDVLKRNYTKLYKNLPNDYKKTISTIPQYLIGASLKGLLQLKFEHIDEMNAAIICRLLLYIMKDEDVLKICDVLDCLNDDVSSKQVIEVFRNEVLEALCSPPPVITTTSTPQSNNSLSSTSGSHHPTSLQQMLHEASASNRSNLAGSTSAFLQKAEGIKLQLQPPMPPNYVCRQQKLDTIVAALCQNTANQDSSGTTVTVTGLGGFGKTSIVTALCHHHKVQQQFTDGFLFIELGLQATDPFMKLSQLYHLLKGEYLKKNDSNHAEKEIQELTRDHGRNLLVIIDDVWHVEDAEPIVRAFRYCEIVLTTRINDIDKYIPTKQVVCVGPMEQSEAISLLTFNVIDSGQLPQEDVTLLNELAHDIYHWPLLLSLIRGQLHHFVKQQNKSHKEAIKHIKAKLNAEGLTSFDKSDNEKGRKYATKVCIELTLKSLRDIVPNKLKSLILWTGIGTSLQTAVLCYLWNTTEPEANDIVDELNKYGLVQFTDIRLPPQNKQQRCVQVHVVISQYIMESMESKEALLLSPFGGLGTANSTLEGLKLQCRLCYGLNTSTLIETLPAIEFLKFRLYYVENLLIPYYLKTVNMRAVSDPHDIMYNLNAIKQAAMTSLMVRMSIPTLGKDFDLIVSKCHGLLKSAHKMSRTLNQTVQRCLTEKNYEKMIQSLKTYMEDYRIAVVAKETTTLVEKVIPFCHGNLLDYIKDMSESIYMATINYHHITLSVIPNIESFTKEITDITRSLQAGSAEIKKLHQIYISGKHDEQVDKTRTTYYHKLLEVAPNYAKKLAQRLGLH